MAHYITGWSSIIELQSGQVVSDAFDSTFGAINNVFIDVEARLDATENTTANQETRIGALETIGLGFSYTPEAGFSVISESYDEAVSTTHIFSAPIGIVMYGYSITFSGTVNDKLWIEMTVPNIDGTAGTPFEHVFEIKDSAEVRPKTYFFPRNHTLAITSGQVKLRFRKGAGDANFTVNFIDVMTEIKG